MSQGAERPFTLLLVPARIDAGSFDTTPPWLDIKPFPKLYEADPLAWMDKHSQFTLLHLEAKPGYLDKRRGWAGRLELADPEQHDALVPLVRRGTELTNRRWVALLNWTGADAEVTTVENLDVLESLRIPQVEDRALRFWREYRLGDIE